MRLLFDANLSRRLLAQLEDIFPGSIHASALGGVPTDTQIWDHAKAYAFTIVSRDTDFYRMSAVWGAPPKVVWLRMGNVMTAQVANVLRSRQSELILFEADPTTALMIIQP